LCNLHALEQPRFFYGQLLTDQDLTALLTWSQDKMALDRWRAGWGVVCGLAVEPATAGRVLIKAGYVRTCCGQDIIVPADVTHDLQVACRSMPTGCADPTVVQAQPTRDTQPVIVDLYLRYKTVETNVQTALRRSACQSVQKCEPSRLRESYELWGELVIESTTPTDPFQYWKEKYQNWLNKIAPSSEKEDADAHLRCILQHFHRVPLIGTCNGCTTGAAACGVPLARIYLKKNDDASAANLAVQPRPTYEVTDVDTYPPFRRPLMHNRLPAPAGKLNLAHFLWQRLDDVASDAAYHLQQLGFHVQEEVETDATNALTRVRADTAEDSTALCAAYAQRELTVITVDLGAPLGKRIISFRQDAT
jgi:hypothetical protein